MKAKKYQRFADFWPYYVSEHANPRTRKLHFWGTHNLLFWLCLAVVRRSPKLFIFAVVSSYAFAWYGHFFVEKNRPATLDYPILSAFGDIQMYIKTWLGQMDAEVAKYVHHD